MDYKKALDCAKKQDKPLLIYAIVNPDEEDLIAPFAYTGGNQVLFLKQLKNALEIFIS